MSASCISLREWECTKQPVDRGELGYGDYTKPDYHRDSPPSSIENTLTSTTLQALAAHDDLQGSAFDQAFI